MSTEGAYPSAYSVKSAAVMRVTGGPLDESMSVASRTTSLIYEVTEVSVGVATCAVQSINGFDRDEPITRELDDLVADSGVERE